MFTAFEVAALLAWTLTVAGREPAARVVGRCTVAATGGQPRSPLDTRLSVELAPVEPRGAPLRPDRTVGMAAVRAVQAALVAGALDIQAEEELERTATFLRRVARGYPW